MCGIVGLFCKSPELEPRLGELLAAMLVQMSDRGPDSAGVAVYRDAAPDGWTKLTLYSSDPAFDWGQVGRRAFVDVRERHAVVLLEAEVAEAEASVRSRFPGLRVMSAGRVIEIYKEVGPPRDFADRVQAARVRGHARPRPHADGDREPSHHRGLASRSRPAATSASSTTARSRTTTGSGKRSAARGSPSRPRTTPRWPPAYLTWRLREGDTLEAALESCLDALDGFYTFLVGTADGFAVLRDPIACKPAMLAETDDWVAMASEYRAIAVLPGARDAVIWEPEPTVVYAWEKELVR